MNLAAGAHLEQPRFSITHWAIETGTLEQGARKELTYPLHSFFSRGVSALTSTPGIVTSAFGLEGSFEASPPGWPRHVELDNEKRRRRPEVS
jgi:hypothetical protein